MCYVGIYMLIGYRWTEYEEISMFSIGIEWNVITWTRKPCRKRPSQNKEALNHEKNAKNIPKKKPSTQATLDWRFLFAIFCFVLLN